MHNEIPVSLLKPHPRNAEFFPEKPPENIWQEILADIEANGIINPLIITPDYTVLTGHLRLEAAKECGLTHVPVIIKDIDPESEEAISLMIRDNLLRRHLTDLQIAKLIKVLKEKYNIRRGRPEGSKNVEKNSAILAQFFGLPKRTFYRLDKLNELIPELQKLLETGRWDSTTVASIIASLPSEEQEQLFNMLGEKGISSLSIKEAHELKKELDKTRKEKEALQSQLAALEREKETLLQQIEKLDPSAAEEKIAEKITERLAVEYEEKMQAALFDLQRKLRRSQEEINTLRAKLQELEENPVEKVVEKVVYRTDPTLQAELEAARTQAAELSREKDFLRQRLQEVAREKEQKEIKLKEIEAKNTELENRYEHLKKEFSKEKSRSRLTPEQEEAFLTMEKAHKAAIELAEALKTLMDRHPKQVRACFDESVDFSDLSTLLKGALTPRMLELSLHIVSTRLAEFYDFLEKPQLTVIKGGGESSDREKIVPFRTVPESS